jgi:cellulose synthase/poly-beta-1,6-N-acetylglucosamine synthase-like glycosyltransferase
MKNKLTFTIGIPTYYGGPGLIKTAKSILASKGVSKFRFIFCVDGNPLDASIEAQLKDLGIEVVFSKKRGGQVARINQMIKLTKTDILVLTQDDILFTKATLANVIQAFQDDKELTMASGRCLPTPAKIFFEEIIETGVRATLRVGDNWNNGDNYLLSTGRLLAFRTDFVKKLNIPEDVINSDAYLYFENKRKGGKFRSLKDAIIYNKSPQNLKEHLKQSKKFQYSSEELSHFVKADLTQEYKPSKLAYAKALATEVLLNPIPGFLYLGIFAYTRIAGKGMYSNAKRFWDTDKSTKKL